MSEDQMQQVWAFNPLAGRRLHTRCGSEVVIMDSGVLNSSDGPDFLEAHILINGISCHGAIELHLRSSGWIAHRHEFDPAFDNVILHVVLIPEEVTIKRTDGTVIPELSLEEEIPDFQKMQPQQETSLSACPVEPVFISEEAIRIQLQKARNEYFSRKVDDFFKFYDPGAGIEEAWKKALITSVFDGMGIPHNRTCMVRAAGKMNAALFHGSVDMDGVEAAALLAEFKGYNWKHKRVGYAAHPLRIFPKMLNFAQQIHSEDFADVIKTRNSTRWDTWMRMAGLQNYYKARVLKATVYLPALYAAAALTSNKKLGDYAKEAWNSYDILLPGSIRRELGFLPEESFEYASRQLSSVHQIREWCAKHRCEECEVLKRAFAS